jgi:RHS repeat-associated protein
MPSGVFARRCARAQTAGHTPTRRIATTLAILIAVIFASATAAQAETKVTEKEIKTNTTWTAAGSPYIIEAVPLKVNSGVTLKIEPGVTVELNPKKEEASSLIEVKGTIKSLGSEASPILFTSVPAAKNEAAPGQYRGVEVESGNAESAFSYTDFRYGGYGTGGCYGNGALTITKGSTVAVEHSLFEWNLKAGIKLSEATANVSYSTFVRNCTGISSNPFGGVLSVSHSTLSENNLEGSLGGNGADVSGRATGSSNTFSYDVIRGNRTYGIQWGDSCTRTLSAVAHGENNDIYENGSPEQTGDQLRVESVQNCKPPVEANWKHNYWGEVAFAANSGSCATTETPYAGHLIYPWSTREIVGEIPLGPIQSGEATHLSEGFSCAWDSFLIEEALSAPVEGAGAPGTTAAPELRASELFGDRSDASPNLPHCMRGDPVNCATGNLFESQTDLNVNGLNGGLNLTRAYNSGATVNAAPGPFGVGWTFEYGMSLSVESISKAVTIVGANGATTTFRPREGGGYSAPPWVQAKLEAGAESTYLYTLPNQTVYTFNSSGQLTKITDRHENTTTLKYGSGKLESVTDPAGRKLSFEYNAEGFIKAAKDPLGHEVKYEYSGKNLTNVTQPGEVATRWHFEYDSFHRLTLMEDGRKGKTKNKYDGNGRVEEQTDPRELKTKWAYNQGETKVTDPTGAVTQMLFTGHVPVSITRGYGTSSATTETFAFDGSDNLTSVTDGNGHTTKYEYDSEDNRTKLTDADNNETKWTYNSKHDVLTITTPKGETTTIKRKANGDPEKIERPAPNLETQTTTYEYNTLGELTKVTDPLSRVTEYEYPASANDGERIAEIDPLKDKRTFEYDGDGFEKATVSPRGNVEGGEPAKYTTKIERDAQERPTKVTDPLGHETKYVYDEDGNLKAVTDANGHTTKYVYDADNERTKVEEPNGVSTETAYDEAGRVKSQTDGRKKTTEYKRNILGQVTEVIDPLSRKTKKTYDAAGNLKTLEDALARTTTYEYDPANRLTKVSYSDGKTHSVEYEYDKDGNRTKMIDATGTNKYEYDVLDRLTESKDGHGDVVKYEYDLANQLKKITYPNGKAVTRAFDNAGRLEKVTDWSEHTTKFAYNADSEPTETTWPSATSETDKYTYNEADQMTEAAFKKGSEVLASVVYTRDGDGQVKSATPKGLPGGESEVAYEYDAANRLKKAATTEYAYDESNDPTKLGSTTDTFDSADEIEKAGTATLTYDSVGERTKTAPSSGPATTYGYDQAGDLTSVERKKEGMVPEIKDSYGYDGNSLRASQTISGTTKFFAWDVSGSLPLLLTDGTNSYIYGPSGLPLEQISSGGTVLYLHHDQQGSTRMLTGSTGTVEGKSTYDAYGNLSASSGTATTPLGYDGQYTNSDTGLIYLRARAYDPATAQFMSADPLLAVTRATYGFAAQNPANRSDPTGLWVGVDDLIASGVGFIAGGTVSVVGQIASGEGLSFSKTLIAAGAGAAGGESSLYCGPACGGAVAGGLNDLGNQLAGTGKVNLPELGASTALGGVFGRASGLPEGPLRWQAAASATTGLFSGWILSGGFGRWLGVGPCEESP